MATDDDDRKVKEILDAGTRADLERWFGLPSITELDEAGKPLPAGIDPEVLEVQERQARAMAAVDPDMLARHAHRTSGGERMLRFKATIEPRVDSSILGFDESKLPRGTAEAREVEIPQALLDDLRQCTPQAILRDLHRPEMEFRVEMEMVDFEAEMRVNGSAIVREALAQRYSLSLEAPLFAAGVALLRELRADRFMDVTEALEQMPNRRVTG